MKWWSVAELRSHRLRNAAARGSYLNPPKLIWSVFQLPALQKEQEKRKKGLRTINCRGVTERRADGALCFCLFGANKHLWGT